MVSYWMLVNKVINHADILLEVIDARMIEESRNPEIEDKVRESGKTLIYVINKCDLVDKEKMDEAKKHLRPSVFISAKEHLGTSYLRDAIMRYAPNSKFRVGVLGYPNTGKSSVINVLRGKSVAKTSPVSGYTTGLQVVKISQRMYLIDTPGVFPYKEKDDTKHAMIAAKTFSNLKDPEESAMKLLENFSKIIEEYYGVEHDDDADEVLGRIALKIKKLKKGGLPDTNAAARVVLKDWQEGRIKSD